MSLRFKTFFLAIFLFVGPQPAQAFSCAVFFERLFFAAPSPEKIAEWRRQVKKDSERFETINERSTQLLGRSANIPEAHIIRDDLAAIEKQIAVVQNKLAHAGQGYAVIPMREEFLGENGGLEETIVLRAAGTRTAYLSPSRRDETIVHFDAQGLARASNGTLLRGKYIFVMDASGEVRAIRYLSELSRAETQDPSHTRLIHHSSLSGGLPVAAAGEIVFENGKIVKINRKSGHYLPSKKYNKQLLVQLNKVGISTQDIEVDSY